MNQSERLDIMKPVWHFSVMILVLLSFGSRAYSESLSVSSKYNLINIGAIFSLETLNGKVSYVGMQAAIDDINSDPTMLSGRNLSLTVHDANRSGFLGIMGALQFMEMDAVAIIGPQTSKMAHVLSPLANQLHTPLLSFTALDPTMSPLQYPYFIQTAPNDLFQMSAIADTITHFGWKQVVAIFTEGDETRNGIDVLGHKLWEQRCKITYKAALPHPDDDMGFGNKSREGMMRELLKVKMMVESRVIVLHTSTIYGPIIFQLAEELEMMESKDYVWFATSWLSNVLDSAVDQNLMMGSIQGVLTLRHHVPDSKRKRDLVTRLDKLISRISNDDTYSGSIVGLNPYGLYAYDTVWLIARALDAFLGKGNNITFTSLSNEVGAGSIINLLSSLSIFDGGEDLLKLILRSSVTGVTGQMSSRTNDREKRYMGVNPSFDVLNVVHGNRLQLVGQWSKYSGLSSVGDVVWPGGGRKAPRGWVFPRNGRKLRIGVPYQVSFKDFVLVDSHNTSNVTGCSIDVFLAAIRLLPYPVPFEFVAFGDKHHKPNIDDLLNRVKTNEFDAAVGDIAIVTERTSKVDFTLTPFMESGLVVVVRVQKMSSSSNAWAFLRAFLKPFTPLMWAVTSMFFFYLAAVIWFVEHRVNPQFRGPPREQFVTALCFSFSTMFLAHRQNVMSTLGRMVLIFWLFVVYIIQQSYTASLASILTVQQLSSPIKGIDSLITSNGKIGYQVRSYAENYLNQQLDIRKSRLVALTSEEDYVSALENGTVEALVDESPYVEIFVSRHCQFTIVGTKFTKNGWGFAFPRGSPLAVDFSDALLLLSEKEDFQKIIDEWKPKKGHCSTNSPVESNGRLRFGNFAGLFLIFGTACFIALPLYFCILVCKFVRQERANLAPSGGSPFVCFRTFLSFIDKKE